MTTIPFNETRMCIEETLASAGYGEKMTSLANQYRREGNHAAANAAIIMTWNIRTNIAKVIEFLPMLTPEHTQLLNPSERQQLTTELTTSYTNLERLVQEHPVTEAQLDDSHEQEKNLYMSCLHIGHLAHLAHSISERAARFPDDEELTEVMKFSINTCYQEAQESIEDIQNNQPSEDNVFPQTRNQAMNDALRNYAALETINQQFTEKLKTLRAEATNSPGWCHLCGDTFLADEAKAHIETCITQTVEKKYIIRDFDERYARSSPVMIWVRSEELRHWMMLVMQPTTSLRQLDQFLRNQWLECCGHMSHFEIGKVHYSACVPGPGDPPNFDTAMAEPNEQHMVHTIEETVTDKDRFSHEFDYGDTTCLDLEHVAALPFPYYCLPDLIKPPKEAEGYSDDFITIVARNQPPEHCFTCRKTARWRYSENDYIQTPRKYRGPIVAPPYFCDPCLPKDISSVKLRNSPRAGVGCYDNTHDIPHENVLSNEPTGDPEHLAILLKATEANHIIYWTAPHYNTAGEEIQAITDLVRLNGNDLHKSLAAIEESMLQWENKFIQLLPSSWEKLVDTTTIQHKIISNMMDYQFEPKDHFNEEQTGVEGKPDDVMAAIHEQYILAKQAANELIHDYTKDEYGVDNGPIESLDTDERIVRIIETARQIMEIGHSALTGMAVHEMTEFTQTSRAEPPRHSNRESMANAVRTMAYAGAIARAAAKMIDFRIWPLDQD